jgi:hypothetical protein
MGFENVISIAGLKFRILFYKNGYTPHYAEHIIDPRDGKEKLVLADPHNRFSIIIYDPVKRIIEEEIRVPGNMIPNPHSAHIAIERIPEIGIEPGDILCADRAGRWVAIDRDSHKIKWSLNIDGAEWPHDIQLSFDGKGFIVTDYGTGGYGGFIRKVLFNGSTMWSLPMYGAAKISRIFGSTASGVHTNSFGGNYIATQNGDFSGIYEVDEDGFIAWQCPKGIGNINNIWLFKPHSAFRLGLAELGGNLTVVGLEAGGGIIAIDYFCRPRWGIMSTYTIYPTLYYRPSRYGFMETTHVFPTLQGTIGAIDWRGYSGSMIFELIDIPKTSLSWILAWDLDPGSRGIWLDPPLEILDYDFITITLINIGEGSIKWSLYATTQPLLIEDSFDVIWNNISTGLLDNDRMLTIEIDNQRKHYTFLRLNIARGVENIPTKTRIIVTWL